jgi:hypothetical protein
MTARPGVNSLGTETSTLGHQAFASGSRIPKSRDPRDHRAQMCQTGTDLVKPEPQACKSRYTRGRMSLDHCIKAHRGYMWNNVWTGYEWNRQHIRLSDSCPEGAVKIVR